jgi:Endopolygalacturonase
MGAIATVQRNLNFINVKDYGAQGDGVTDDAAAINAAINASASGARIFFPAGTFLVGSQIILKQNRSYHGAAYGATIISQKNGANLDSILAAAGYVNNNVFVDVSLSVENLFIDGNWNNNTTGHGLVLMNSFAIVRQVWCNNIPGAGIVVSDRSMANISTTITQTIGSTGSQSVSVGSSTGMSVGMSLAVDPTGGNSEAVVVTAIPDSTHITANFTKTHSSGVTLSSFLMNSSIENRIVDCKVASANSSGIWVRDNTVNPGRCTDKVQQH